MPVRVVDAAAYKSVHYHCSLPVSHEITVVASNASHVPDTLATLDFPPRVSPGVRRDGSWGPHEYTELPQLFCSDSPYMGWIPVDAVDRPISGNVSPVFDFDISLLSFKPNRAWPSRGTVDSLVLDAFQEQLNSIYLQVTEAITRVKSRPALSGIRLPLRAVERAYASLLALHVNFLTRRDLLEYVACLKRSIAELRGFILWADEIDCWLADSVVSTRRSYAARGSVCEDLATYDALCRMGIPVWCFVSGLSVASHTTEQALSKASYCCPPMSGTLLHNKALFFYPPVVDDTRTFELAARGYAPRVDKLHRDKGYRKDLGAMEAVYDKMNREKYETERCTGVLASSSGGLLPGATDARLLGLTIYNLNFSALLHDIDLNPSPPTVIRPSPEPAAWTKMWDQSRNDVPPWVMPHNPAWDIIAQPGSNVPGFGRETLRPSERVHMMHVLPLPSYFFHIKSAEKLKSYFFIWTTIRRFVVARHAQSGFSSFDVALTAQSWRDVLSGVYFKCRNSWRGKEYDPVVDKVFELANFWQFGGPLVFGADDDPSEDKTPLCIDGSKLTPSEFDSPRLRAFILWDLSVLHCQTQLDRADVLIFDGSNWDPREVSARNRQRRVMFRPEGCDLSLSNCPWDNQHISARKPWFDRFQTILSGWPYFEDAVNRTAFLDLDGQSPWKYPKIVDLALLSDRDYEAFEGTLIYIYYRGVVDALGIVPVVPFKKPTYVGDLKKFMSI
ncbi:hypothetical protein B0H11DRAFT_2223392 [Mycena galericulata]|nr:hypothetical protein B0H11DRAFT_2223392 [Mycena galericulata]